jgi:hypothetical protein
LRQFQTQGFGYTQALAEDEQKQTTFSRFIATTFGGCNHLFDFMTGEVFSVVHVFFVSFWMLFIPQKEKIELIF